MRLYTDGGIRDSSIMQLNIVAIDPCMFYTVNVRNGSKGRTDMKNTMEYKGYTGSVEFSEEDTLLYGKVLGIRSLISYEGKSARELVEDFHGAVDAYLAACASDHVKPEKPFKGSFNIRIAPELHKRLYLEALSRNMTLNSLVQEKLSAGQQY